MVLAMFHLSEYITTALSNPQNLSFDSFLVNHSLQYWAAMLASWLEFVAINFFFPQLKASLGLVTYTGLLVCLVGEIIRKLAMLHAGRNFNHLVQSHKSREHKLVTTGIYAWSRHPSYLGWFLWSVGTQVIIKMNVSTNLFVTEESRETKLTKILGIAPSFWFSLSLLSSP